MKLIDTETLKGWAEHECQVSVGYPCDHHRQHHLERRDLAQALLKANEEIVRLTEALKAASWDYETMECFCSSRSNPWNGRHDRFCLRVKAMLASDSRALSSTEGETR